MSSASSFLIGKALTESGVIPRDCTRWQMTLEVGNPVRVVSESCVSREDYEKIAAALAANKPLLAREIVEHSVSYIGASDLPRLEVR